MSKLLATFPAGTTELTVHGLTQWDYGRELQITHPDLTGTPEVHFSAMGSKAEAIRYRLNDAGSVRIPDELLEQARHIVAWVYIASETSGETVLTITLPVTGRTKPAESPTDSDPDATLQLVTRAETAAARAEAAIQGVEDAATAAKNEVAAAAREATEEATAALNAAQAANGAAGSALDAAEEARAAAEAAAQEAQSAVSAAAKDAQDALAAAAKEVTDAADEVQELVESLGGSSAPATIDLSALDTEGKIVETYADGASKTTTMEFDADGNPVKITDSDGNVTTLIW